MAIIEEGRSSAENFKKLDEIEPIESVLRLALASPEKIYPFRLASAIYLKQQGHDVKPLLMPASDA